MINIGELKDGELARTLTQLHSFNRNNWRLKEELSRYWKEYDTDGNDTLDHAELRHFIVSFFKEYHVRLPVTDEFIDATFREIDENKDGMIQFDELLAFATRFIKTLLVQYETVREMMEQQSPGIPNSKRAE